MSNYSYYGLGCDRTTGAWGTGYSGDYAPSNAAMFNNVETCPVNLLLWFHNLAWTHLMPKPPGFKPYPLVTHGDASASARENTSKSHGSGGNGTITLYELIRFTHFDSVEQAKAMAAQWDGLKDMVDEHRYRGVQARFAQQIRDATQMAYDIMVQYERWSKHKAP